MIWFYPMIKINYFNSKLENFQQYQHQLAFNNLCVNWQRSREATAKISTLIFEISMKDIVSRFKFCPIIFNVFLFQQFLDVDVTLPVDKVSSLANTFFSKLNNVLLKLKSILLVENVVESVKVRTFFL